MKNPAHYQSLEYERIETLFGEFARGRDRPLRALDYGCGRGKYLACLSSLGYDVTGVDSNPSYVAEARSSGFRASAADAFFAENSDLFDVVLLSHLIEHLAPLELIELIPRLCGIVARGGCLVIVTPTHGERFYHDFTHVRPYLPQSVRHAFGQTGAPISFGSTSLIELVDIHFFRDPFRTRSWRSFYVGSGAGKAFTWTLNLAFDAVWRISGGRVGVVASWLGVYKVKDSSAQQAPS